MGCVARRSIDIVLHGGPVAMRWGNPGLAAEVGAGVNDPKTDKSQNIGYQLLTIKSQFRNSICIVESTGFVSLTSCNNESDFAECITTHRKQKGNSWNQKIENLR